MIKGSSRKLHVRMSRTWPHLVAVAAMILVPFARSGNAQDSDGQVENPLFAELSKATFVEHTPEQVLEKLDSKTVGL